MGTRWAIGRPVESNGDPTQYWEARYGHWDGYPSGVGKELWLAYRSRFFQRNVGKMLDVLVNQHPAGWSTINNVDWGIAPGFNEYGVQPQSEEEEIQRRRRAQCYCHGDRHEDEQWVRPEDDCGCEYAYILDPIKRTMLILGARRHSGERAVGAFGTIGGEESFRWALLWEGPLDGPEPDWEALDQR